MPDLLRWRWTPCIALVTGSVLYVGIVVSALPAEWPVALADSYLRSSSGSEWGSSQTLSTAQVASPDAPSPLPPPSPVEMNTDAQQQPKDLRGLGRRGFSPPLPRPEPPPPPPAPIQTQPPVPPPLPPAAMGAAGNGPQSIGNAAANFAGRPHFAIKRGPRGVAGQAPATEIQVPPEMGVVPAPASPPLTEMPAPAAPPEQAPEATPDPNAPTQNSDSTNNEAHRNDN